MTSQTVYVSPTFAVNFGWHYGRKKYFAERIRFETYRPRWSEIENRFKNERGWNSKSIKFFDTEEELLSDIKII